MTQNLDFFKLVVVAVSLYDNDRVTGDEVKVVHRQHAMVRLDRSHIQTRVVFQFPVLWPMIRLVILDCTWAAEMHRVASVCGSPCCQVFATEVITECNVHANPTATATTACTTPCAAARIERALSSDIVRFNENGSTWATARVGATICVAAGNLGVGRCGLPPQPPCPAPVPSASVAPAPGPVSAGNPAPFKWNMAWLSTMARVE